MLCVMYQLTYSRKCFVPASFLICLYAFLLLFSNPGSGQPLPRERVGVIEKIEHGSDVQVRQSFTILMAVDPVGAVTVPCLPPVGFREGNRISSGYGWRKHPILGRQAHHAGIDIAGVHQYIRAAATGLVEQTGYDARLGYYVRLNHQNSYRTVYGHLARVLVSRGDLIQIGEKIGVLGRSGAATGLHLHYTVTKNGVPLDPAPYLTLAINLVNWYQRPRTGSTTASPTP